LRARAAPLAFEFRGAEARAGRDNWAGVDDNFVIPCVVSFALLAAREWTAIDLGRF